MLKKFLYILLILIALVLIAAYFVDGKFTYSKSITINAPIEKVWSHTSSLAGLDEWSPWNALDPNMKKELKGTDGTVGAEQCWVGNDDAGSGCQTITGVEAPNKLNTDIHFKEPFDSKAKATVLLQAEGTATKATWSFESETPYPWRIMHLFMNMGKMMDEPFQKGLDKLKDISEKP